MQAGRVAFIAQWTVATAAAVAMTDLVAELVFIRIFGLYLLPFFPFAGFGIGAAIGTSQWIVLRRRLPASDAWIGATTFGCGASWLLGVLAAYGLAAVDFAPRLLVASTTCLIGAAQALVIRRWHGRVVLWLLVSAFGWILAAALVAADAPPIPALNDLGGRLVSYTAGFLVSSTFGDAVVGSLVAGAVTGIGLVGALHDSVRRS